MRFIKLFEAFDSSKLTKTLAFINKDSRNKFINLLKWITSNIDFPMSKLGDDYFEYLSFKKALNLNLSYDDEVCTATSQESYPEYYVPGSSCDKGHVDRKWGRGIRSAICMKCNGTGIKPRREFEVKWIKFWFDKDGNYITSTLTDGRIRKQNDKPLDKILLEYDVKDLTFSELTSLETGATVYIRISGYYNIGTIWKGKDGSNLNATFIIQDFSSGSEDDNGDSWKKFGRYSWLVDSPDDYSGIAKLLKPKVKGLDSIEEVDPYTWNAPFQFNRWGGSFDISNSSNVENLLSKAHFSIVLNFLDLKKSEFKKSSDINSERQIAKSGAFKSNDEVKGANIQNYISTLVKNAKLPTEIENLNSTIMRFMGGPNIGLYVLTGKNSNDFNNFITYLYRVFNDENKESSYKHALEYLRSIIESNIKFNMTISLSISKLKKKIIDSKKLEYLSILESILELNKTINDKFKSTKFETIEDLEIFNEKIKSIRVVFKDSDRLRLRDIYYIIEYLGDSSRMYYRIEDIDNIEVCLDKMSKFKKFIERL